MGMSYSINGYLNAVMHRSCKTLLVEGSTDQHAIHRMIAESGIDPRQGVVDHAGMLEEAAISGIGNKEKINIAKQAAAEISALFPKLGELFGTLVDREWDGLQTINCELSGEWAPPVQQEPHFVTVGHSIENYHFDVECILGFIKQRFSAFYSPELEQKIRDRFLPALGFGAAFSICAKEHSVLKKCAGLIELQHINFNGNIYLLREPFEHSCAERQIETADALVGLINAAMAQYWQDRSSDHYARWVLHGHIGSDVLWACAGHSALECGVPIQTANDIARGYQADRKFYWMDWLSKATPERRWPLDSTSSWLLRGRMA